MNWWSRIFRWNGFISIGNQIDHRYWLVSEQKPSQTDIDTASKRQRRCYHSIQHPTNINMDGKYQDSSPIPSMASLFSVFPISMAASKNAVALFFLFFFPVILRFNRRFFFGLFDWLVYNNECPDSIWCDFCNVMSDCWLALPTRLCDVLILIWILKQHLFTFLTLLYYFF